MRIAAFTLIELTTVIVIICILSVMLVGIWSDLRKRAERGHCVSNLKNLYTAAAAYVQEQGHWPQVDSALLESDESLYAQEWIGALKPVGLGSVNWLCPTVQRELGNPDIKQPNNVRVDYIAQPFDDRPAAPFEFPTQPWFVERGDTHTGGNLVIFTNGQIASLSEIARAR